MNTLLKIYLPILCVFFFSFIELYSQNQMGVETGWGNWQASTGNYSGGAVTFTNTVIPTGPRFTITSGTGIDACTPGPLPGSPTIPLVSPGFGNASIQLGQTQTNGNLGGCTGGCVERLIYKFNVGSQDTNLVISCAMVIEDGGHSPADQPFVSFYIIDQNGDTVNCSSLRFTGGSSIPGFYTSNCTVNGLSYYQPWITHRVNLAYYVGQTLTAVITNSDCGTGDHFAHSYWDFAGALSRPKCCFGQPLTLCADTTSSKPYGYQWYKNSNFMLNATAQCITIVPQKTDTFFVHIMTPSSCNNFYQTYIPEDTCFTGIENHENTPLIFISPNPSNGEFIILCNVTMLRVDIYNLFGGKIYSSDIGRQQPIVSFDISSQPNGIYFIRINTFEGILTKKIILQK